MTIFARFLLAGTLALGALPSGALAVDAGQYVSMAGVYVLPLDSEFIEGGLKGDLALKNGGGVVAAFGYERYKAGAGIRLEAELGYRSVDVKSIAGVFGGKRVSGTGPLNGDQTAFSFMLNGYYAGDFEGFRPYVGGGIGLALIDVDFSIPGVIAVSEDYTTLAFQMMIGMGYKLTDNAEVRLGYRFFGAGEGSLLVDETLARFYMNNFEAGIAYRF